MQYIIFDLEATCWEGNQMDRRQEIIEIGAIRLDEYGGQQGTFQRFVKPLRHPSLSVYCKKLTGIQQQDVDSASSFKRAGTLFREWIESDDEAYKLCCWGHKDKILLEQDCIDAGMETDWLNPCLDLKQQYHQLKGLSRKHGLKKCLAREGIEFDGSHHRALDDAKNLTQLFIRYFDMWAD
jgi:inhibitor of KinA sporulation pathway (predicted exonuclease)